MNYLRNFFRNQAERENERLRNAELVRKEKLREDYRKNSEAIIKLSRLNNEAVSIRTESSELYKESEMRGFNIYSALKRQEYFAYYSFINFKIRELYNEIDEILLDLPVVNQGRIDTALFSIDSKLANANTKLAEIDIRLNKPYPLIQYGDEGYSYNVKNKNHDYNFPTRNVNTHKVVNEDYTRGIHIKTFKGNINEELFRFVNIFNIRELFDVISDSYQRFVGMGGELVNIKLRSSDDNGNYSLFTIRKDSFLDGNNQPNYDLFRGRIEQKIAGEIYGSGAFQQGDNLDLSYFKLLIMLPVDQVRGKSDNMLFLTHNLKYGRCINESMEIIGHPLLEETTELNYLIQCIVFRNLPINIIENKIYPEGDVKCKKLVTDDVHYKYIYNSKIPGARELIYDFNDSHVDVIKTPLTIDPSVYFNEYYDVYKGDVLIHRRLVEPIDKEKKNKDYTKVFIGFDILFYDDYNKSQELVPYAISLSRNGIVVTLTGSDLLKQFSEWTLNNQNGNERMIFIGYNNSNITNYSIFESILNSNNEDLRVNPPFITGNDMLKLTVNSRHFFWDLKKHIPQKPLKEVAESFKVSTITKLNHKLVQEVLSGNAEIEDELLQEIIHHSKNNVITIMNVFNLYSDVLKGEELTKHYKPTDFLTFPSMLYKIHVNYTKRLDVGKLGLPGTERMANTDILSVPRKPTTDPKYRRKKILQYTQTKLDLSKFNLVEESRIGGRVNVFKGIVHIKESVVNIDACSLHAYVMCVANYDYPYGEVVDSDIFVPDKLGFYYCDVSQSNLWDNKCNNIIPFTEVRGRSWNHRKILFNIALCSKDILELLEYGCSVKIRSGFYFTHKIKGIDLFGYLLKIMEKKNNLDITKENPALREIYKLMYTSISGNLNRGLYEDNVVMLQSLSALYILKDKYKNINVINIPNNNTIFVEYKKKREDLLGTQHPIYIGSFIYAYARSHMYRSTLGFANSLYTDTDSNLLTLKHFNELKLNLQNWIVPHSPKVEEFDPRYKTHRMYEEDSKVFGSFEIDCVGTEVIILGNKFYCINATTPKLRLPGIKHDSVEVEPGIKESEYYSKYQNSVKISESPWSFFLNVFRDRKAYVLSQTYNKSIKNSLNNVDHTQVIRFNSENLQVKVKRFIKEITISEDSIIVNEL